VLIGYKFANAVPVGAAEAVQLFARMANWKLPDIISLAKLYTLFPGTKAPNIWVAIAARVKVGDAKAVFKIATFIKLGWPNVVTV